MLRESTKAETHQLLHTKEPASQTQGRPILYDAVATSSNGEASCASCHIFGDMDDLAWDLGNPDDHVTQNPMPAQLAVAAGDQNGGAANDEFHPMKGPMTTQTLRGMAFTHGALHWRGDRVDGFFGLDPCTEPTGAPCSEDFSFRNFIVAFEGLVGKHGTISTTDMLRFSDFMLQVMLPPNPVANLNGTLTAAQTSGRNLFLASPGAPNSDTVATCDG